jgi:allantoinase
MLGTSQMSTHPGPLPRRSRIARRRCRRWSGGANFFKVWGGIAGVQHLLLLLLTEWKAGLRSGAKGAANDTEPGRRPELQAIAQLISFNVAERFKLPQTKGRLSIGADADLALVDLKQQFTVRTEDLFHRHKQSAHVGRALTGRVVRTILRG